MRRWLAAFYALSLLGGCAGFGDETEVDGDVQDARADVGKGDGPSLRYTFVPNASLPTAKVQTEARRVFRTAASFRQYFGAEPPGLDFNQRWLVFYTPGAGTPGLRNERGWKASLVSVRTSDSGATLKVTTRLERIVAGCPGPTGPTRPFVLASFARPAKVPASNRYYRDDRTKTCDATLEYYEGVAFTALEGARALAAANGATRARLLSAGLSATAADGLLAVRPFEGLRLLSGHPGVDASTLEALKRLGASYTAVQPFQATRASLANIVSSIEGALRDDEGLFGDLLDLVRDVTADDDAYGVTIQTAIDGVLAQARTKASTLDGRGFSSAEVAHSLLWQHVQDTRRAALADYPRGLLTLVAPKSRAAKLSRAKAGLLAYFRDTFTSSEEWRRTFEGRTWAHVQARVTQDIAAFERAPGFAESPAPNGTMFQGSVYGLYAETTVDDIGKVTRVYIEID